MSLRAGCGSQDVHHTTPACCNHPRDPLLLALRTPPSRSRRCPRGCPTPRDRRPDLPDAAPAPESENGAGPNYDNTREFFGNSTDHLTRTVSRRANDRERSGAVLARPGSLGAWEAGPGSLGAGGAPGGHSRTKERRPCTPGFARRRRLASVGAGDWLRSAPGIGFARRRRRRSGPAGRIFPNEAGPFLHARVRSAPQGPDWLPLKDPARPRHAYRHRPGLSWGGATLPRVMTVRSARGIGFARRRELASLGAAASGQRPPATRAVRDPASAGTPSPLRPRPEPPGRRARYCP